MSPPAGFPPCRLIATIHILFGPCGRWQVGRTSPRRAVSPAQNSHKHRLGARVSPSVQTGEHQRDADYDAGVIWVSKFRLRR